MFNQTKILCPSKSRVRVCVCVNINVGKTGFYTPAILILYMSCHGQKNVTLSLMQSSFELIPCLLIRSTWWFCNVLLKCASRGRKYTNETKDKSALTFRTLIVSSLGEQLLYKKKPIKFQIQILC